MMQRHVVARTVSVNKMAFQVIDAASAESFLKKSWTGCISTASVSVKEYLVLYDHCPDYQLIEDAFRHYCPDFASPKKWSNITRYAKAQMAKGNEDKAVFPSTVTTTATSKSIGFYCNKISINENNLIFPNSSSITLTVGAFRELCLFKGKSGKSWHDVKTWLHNIVPCCQLLVDLSEQRIVYYFKKIQEKFLFNSKRGLKKENDALLESSFECYLSSRKKNQIRNKPAKLLSQEKLKNNTKMKNQLTELDNENKILKSIIIENQSNTNTLERKISKFKTLGKENLKLKSRLEDAHRGLRSIKQENFYKRLKRKESYIKKKEIKNKYKLNKTRVKLEQYRKQNMQLESKIETLKNDKKEMCLNFRSELHKKSNKICYLEKKNQKSEDKLDEKKIQLDCEKQRNVELCKINEEMLIQNENEVTTKQKNGRFNDEMRQCVLELSSLDISSNKIPHVIEAVGKNIFEKKIITPSKSTVNNIIAEGHVLSKQQVGEEVLGSKSWGMFSDGTSRQGKKIMDIGIHTSDKNMYTLGFQPVATEDASTVSGVLKNVIEETAAELEVEVNNEHLSKSEVKTKLLQSLSTLMSDRSSVMKKSNLIIDEWRKDVLENSDSVEEINSLEFLYCSAHVLLGFHSEIEKNATELYKASEPLGRDLDKKFYSFRNSKEPPSFRVIRTACECLGPNGDEKNGARQQWLAYCSMKNIKSMIQSYRGNRFNNIFQEARHIMFLRDEIIDFLTNHFCSPNLKLQSILQDLKCSDIFNQVVCLAAVGTYVTIPFWDLVNSDENYIELYKFFQPLREMCKVWSDNCENLFQKEIDPIFEKYPHKIDEIFACLISNMKKCDASAKKFFSMLSKSLHTVMDRQLGDHLQGKYSKKPEDDLLERTNFSKITNIPAENFFGDLDYAMKRKRNASLFHHSTIIMLKRNKTVNWLKKKSSDAQKKLMQKARTKAQKTKDKNKILERDVLFKRQEILRQIKLRKETKQNKADNELKRVENSVRNMGGIVRSISDIENLMKMTKSLKSKKEKLRDQLLYIKHFMGKDVDKKKLYITTNTVLNFKSNLIEILELNKEKEIVLGTWVAVAYQNNWYPGEVTKIKTNSEGVLYTVNFMKQKKSGCNCYVWPLPPDMDENVDKKFIISSHFEIIPTSGLRFFIVPEFDDIQTEFNNYASKYF